MRTRSKPRRPEKGRLVRARGDDLPADRPAPGEITAQSTSPGLAEAGSGDFPARPGKPQDERQGSFRAQQGRSNDAAVRAKYRNTGRNMALRAQPDDETRRSEFACLRTNPCRGRDRQPPGAAGEAETVGLLLPGLAERIVNGRTVALGCHRPRRRVCRTRARRACSRLDGPSGQEAFQSGLI
jgi:hypothetical protein